MNLYVTKHVTTSEATSSPIEHERNHIAKSLLEDELAAIDQALAELNDRRTRIISSMDSAVATPGRGGKLIQFPAGDRVTVRKSKPGSSIW